MLKQDLIVLYRSLNQLGSLQGVKFAYAVSRNIDLIKPELEALEKVSAPSKEYLEFEKTRVALVEKYAVKGEDGKFIMKNNEYEIPKEKQEELNTEFGKLREENKELFEARENQIKEYNDLLKEESKIELYKVTLNDVPANITVAQMTSVKAIIDESVPSPYK
jgi:hypothetical protein